MLILLILLIPINLISAQAQEALYFSFDKNRNQYIISLEGYFFEKNKKFSTDDLNYLWTIHFGDRIEEFKTLRPVLVLSSDSETISGNIKIFPSDLSFTKTLSFTFNYKPKPLVSIVKYIKDLELILPFTKYNYGEALFPLIFNFSSQNLSYTWKLNDKFYSSIMIDPEGLDDNTKISVYINNLDNSKETASDSVLFKR